MTQRDQIEMLKEELITKLDRGNYSITRLAKEYNFARTTLSEKLCEWGVKVSRQTPATDKIEMLKNTIEQLYCREGRSKSYIARLLEIDRKNLTTYIKEWHFEQGNSTYLTPSNQKFLNKYKQLIKSRLDNDIPITSIAIELNVAKDYLYKTIIPADKSLKHSNDLKNKRMALKAETTKISLKSKSKNDYNIIDLPGEIWVAILGYENYKVSNKGRIKSYKVSYNDYHLKGIQINNNTGRPQVHLMKDGKRKVFYVARLVAHAFVEGHSTERNQVDHKDNNVLNNDATNLQWVTAGENTTYSYDRGRNKVKGYQKNGKFKKLIVGDYEFKTITAAAKFHNVSPSHFYRYIDGETPFPHKITFIY